MYFLKYFIITTMCIMYFVELLIDLAGKKLNCKKNRKLFSHVDHTNMKIELYAPVSKKYSQDNTILVDLG